MDTSNYRTAVDAIAIYTETDLAGTITHVNPKFCEISDYSKQELLGQNHRLLNSGHHPSEFFEDMWRAITSGQVWRGDICNRAKDGQLYWVASAIMPLLDQATGLPRKYISIRFDITPRHLLQNQLAFQAEHDVLTGLANRQLLQQRLEHAMTQADLGLRQIGVCFVDLDGFKAINDRLGHACGDQLLIQVAQRLTDTVQTNDLVARLGGDEFVVVLTQLGSLTDARPIVERVLAALAMPFTLPSDTVNISASVGLTLYPHDKVSADALLRHADHALYSAKQAGRNRFEFFDVAHDTDTSAHYRILASVTHALKHHELVLHYQPKVNMRSGQVVGFEALLRWQHPRDGLVPPLSFLPLVEETDLIIDIGEWVIDQALAQLASWGAAGHVWPVSVNIAARHFHQSDFVQRLQALLARHPSVPHQWLDIEVLESVAMRDIAQVQRTIKACQALGVTFSLDDFGTGYSSLSYLKYLPTETLKIDRAFVRDILDDKDDLALTEAIITLSTVFNRNVVAEGVELAEQGVLLMRLGCDVAQGFGIAKPMPASEVQAWALEYTPAPSWGAWADVRWELSDFPLLVAQYDHLQWVKRVVMAVDGGNLGLTASQLTDHHQCRLGHWYYGHGMARYGHLAEFKALESVHQLVHQTGVEIIRLRDAGQMDEARVACAQLLGMKDGILKLLDGLGKAVLRQH
ncbi:MAG TPA: EAL domain-containing protein [Rhodoferax sp.]|nr:EAL domain-containing protein [Rhodoferax sp.]